MTRKISMAVEKNSAVAAKLFDLAAAHALDGIKQSRWFKSAPAKFKVEDPAMTFTGVEYHAINLSMGGLPAGTIDVPFLCGETEVGGIKASFRVRLDFGSAAGFVINEQ